MASNRYKNGNLPALQHGTQGPLNPTVHPSYPPAAPNNAPTRAPTQMMNQSNVTFIEHRAEMKSEDVHIQYEERAVRVESSKTNNMSTPNVKGLQNAATNYHQPQLTSPGHPGFPSSQRASLPPGTTHSGAPQSHLQITDGERGLAPYSSAGQQPPQRGVEPAVVSFERIGDAEKTTREYKQRKLLAKTEGLAVAVVEEKELVENVSEVVIDDGFRKYILTRCVIYRRIVEKIYIVALKEPEDPEEPKLKEKCIDCCCQAFSCTNGIKRLFCPSSQPGASAIKKIEFMTPILRRGRSRGWVMHNQMIFPLVKNIFRNFWVGTETLMVVVALCLSIASVHFGKNEVFNIVHLGLTILGSVLGVIDGMILVCQCCGKFCCSECEHTLEDAESDEASLLLHREGSNPGNGRCRQCIENAKGTFDIGRMILAELIFYPLLICDIFEVITGKAYHFNNVEDGVSFVLFAISLGLLFFYVYIVRIIVLIAAIYHSQKSRSPPSIEGSDFDPSIKKSALYFQSYFIIHVLAQMVAQILMIITIGIGIHEENKHISSNDSINVSNYLWYMIVAGYVLPVFGLLTFFVVTYFWVQEFPIGICVDVLSILQQPRIEELLELKKTKKEGGERLNKINRYIHFSELQKQFKNLRRTTFSGKFSYPFESPQMVILSIFYALLQLGFVIAARHSLGGEWAIFYVPAGIIGYLANIYVFTVAGFWLLTIMIILSVVTSVLGLIIFCCIFVGYCASGNDRQR